jgi:hypothetical protein
MNLPVINPQEQFASSLRSGRLFTIVTAVIALATAKLKSSKLKQCALMES